VPAEATAATVGRTVEDAADGVGAGARDPLPRMRRLCDLVCISLDGSCFAFLSLLTARKYDRIESGMEQSCSQSLVPVGRRTDWTVALVTTMSGDRARMTEERDRRPAENQKVKRTGADVSFLSMSWLPS